MEKERSHINIFTISCIIYNLKVSFSLTEIRVPEQSGYAVGRFLSSGLLAVGLKPSPKIGGFEIFFI